MGGSARVIGDCHASKVVDWGCHVHWDNERLEVKWTAITDQFRQVSPGMFILLLVFSLFFRVYSTVGLLAPQEGPGRGGSIMSLEEVHEEQWYKMGMGIACGSHWVGAIVGSFFFMFFPILKNFIVAWFFAPIVFPHVWTRLFPGKNEHYNSNSRFYEQQTIQHVLKFRGSLNLNEWFILTAGNFPIHHSRARSCLGLLDSCWSSSLF